MMTEEKLNEMAEDLLQLLHNGWSHRKELIKEALAEAYKQGEERRE